MKTMIYKTFLSTGSRGYKGTMEGKSAASWVSWSLIMVMLAFANIATATEYGARIGNSKNIAIESASIMSFNSGKHLDKSERKVAKTNFTSSQSLAQLSTTVVNHRKFELGFGSATNPPSVCATVNCGSATIIKN